MNSSDLLRIATQVPAALQSMQVQLQQLDDDWPTVVEFRGATPRLNSDYRIKSDWPRVEFSPFMLHPRFWLKNLRTGKSVRFELNLHTLLFKIDKLNY